MRISDWSSDVCSSDLLLERRKERFGIGMFEPIDAQLGAARRLGVEIVRHRDEARDERLIAPESDRIAAVDRSEEHTSELQSLMRISYAVFCLKKNTTIYHFHNHSFHLLIINQYKLLE